MPVWRYPIVGAADTTVSPSSSSTSRSTPCVLGCCGPMLTVMVSVRISGISVQKHYHGGHGYERRTLSLIFKRSRVLRVQVVHRRVLCGRAFVVAFLITGQPIAFEVRPELLFGHLQRL